MNKKALVILAVVIVFGIAGAAAYTFITSPTKAPTPVATNDRQPMVNPSETPSPEPTMPSVDAPSGTYRIVPESSKVSFSIFEMLRGEPKTVIGTTNYISGYFEADVKNLAEASMNVFKINARTFQTDDVKRDNTTRRAILKTEDDANEFIIFTPTAIEGLPATAEIGDELTYRITGDLFISGITKETVFEGKGAFISDTEFNGTASTTVMRSDYSLIVPSFPFLADVADIVSLQIDLVAKKQP